MNQKQQVALTLTSAMCILWGLLAGESLWWVLIPVWGVTVNLTKKVQSLRFIQLQAVDLCLLTVGVSEIVLYFCSTYPANSAHFLLVCLTFIFLWFCMKQWLVETGQKQLIMGVITATGSVLALFTLFFFAFYWVKVAGMGFEDITQFRYLYRPMGMLSNDWASIMLAFVPFATASWFSLPKPYNRISAVACGVITLSVIVSFSRGAIFSLLFFWVVVVVLLFYFRKYTFKRLASGCCFCFAMLALACIPVRSPLLTTLSVAKNTSQVRSIGGRMNKWNDAVHLFSQYPVTGVGAGNFALRSEPLNNQRESTSTGRSTNSWLQLAAEKGLVGLSAYGLFIIVWTVGLFRLVRRRQNRHLAIVICGAGVMACLLREATFSTLFDKPALLLLILLLLWFTGGQNGRKIQRPWGLAVLLVMPVIQLGVLQIKQKSAVRNNKAFIRAYEKGGDGWEKLRESLRLSPDNALLHANKGIYLLSQVSGYNSLVFLNDAPVPDSTIFQATIAFEQAVTLNPADASFQSNLGILQLATGDSVSALRHLKQSLELAPHQSIHHVLCGMFCSGDSIYSRRRFAHAVYYSPDILDSKWFSDLYAQDSIRANSIVLDAEAMLSDSLLRRTNDYLLQACLAKLLLRQGKTDAAENLLREVTQAMPNLNRPWLMLGDIASGRNDTVALQYYERAMLLDPADAWAKIRTGDWHLARNDLSKAFGYYIDALRMAHLAPTEHSRHAYSMYHTPTVSNDVVPPAFYWYISPYVNTQRLANVIAQGYEQEGNANQAALYRQLADGEIEVRELIR